MLDTAPKSAIAMKKALPELIEVVNANEVNESDRKALRIETTKKRATKSILNWFKSATKTNNNYNNNNNNNTNNNNNSINSVNNNNKIEKRKETNCDDAEVPAATDSRVDITLRDFHGVQTLRHLWNKRISACLAEQNELNKIRAHNKLNKSVNCLYNNNNSNTAAEARATIGITATAATATGIRATKRANSLHDCTQLELAPPTTTNTDTDTIDSKRRAKDNFYKYKTAEQAAQFRRYVEQQEQQQSHCIKSNNNDNATQAETTSNIDATTMEETMTMTMTKASPTLCALSNELTATARQAARSEITATKEHNSTAETTIRSSCSTASSSTPTLSSTTKSGTRRKYSFKTHAGKSCVHVPRRLSTAKEAIANSAMHPTSNGVGVGAACGGSMVAKLTQQFNEIIQKDKQLLDDVRRKKGVWMSRGAHVYKVVECSAPTVSRLKENFERHAPASTKPALPVKSVQVLRMQKELIKSRPEKLKLQALPEDNEPSAAALAESKSVKELAAELVPTATNESIEKAQAADQVECASDCVADEKIKTNKQKYAKIYEKLRFRSIFGSGQQKRLSTATPTEEQQLEIKSADETATTTATTPTTTPTTTLATTTATSPVADAELIGAIAAVDQKLERLSAAKSQSLVPDESAINAPYVIINNDDDFEQRIIPKSSFVHPLLNGAKQVEVATQAVNVTLVNRIESEPFSNVNVLPVNDETDWPNYEPIEQPKAQNDVEEEEDVYQTVEEAMESAQRARDDWHADYEYIAGAIEPAPAPAPVAAAAVAGKPPAPSPDNGYETYEAQTVYSQRTVNGRHVLILRNTNDELPELPKPKRVLAKTSLPLPSPPLLLTPLPITTAAAAAATTSNECLNLNEKSTYALDERFYYADEDEDDDDEEEENEDHDDDDDNIYATINGSNFKSVSSAAAAAAAADDDDNSCYESIGVPLTPNEQEAAEDISSNYTGSMSACVLYNPDSLDCRSVLSSFGCGSGSGSSIGSQRKGERRLKSASASAHLSSDNSDDWIDISDTEPNKTKQQQQQERKQQEQQRQQTRQFIVIRERTKAHPNGPDWSKRIRDKRLQQKKTLKCDEEEDSDHYYDKLSALKRRSTVLDNNSQGIPRYALVGVRAAAKAEQEADFAQYSTTTEGTPLTITSDDYDTFDTDTDEHEDPTKNPNDSGVDIERCALPNAPTTSTSTSTSSSQSTSNQVYAIVRKFRNFISNKKSITGGSAAAVRPQNAATPPPAKIYENTKNLCTQENVYEDTPTRMVSNNGKKRPTSLPKSQFYESIQFGTPTTPLENSNSNGNGNGHAIPESIQSNSIASSNCTTPEDASTTTSLGAKTQFSKSLRSRLRKTLAGSNGETKQLAKVTQNRSKFYVEDVLLKNAGSGQLDSGFSEKAASSGDITVTMEPASNELMPKYATAMRKKTKKNETKAQNAERRRAIRPDDPPPPPPPPPTTCEDVQVETAEDKLATPTKSITQRQNSTDSVGGGSSTWYVEAGLYQTSGVSVASSSGSSGVSTGNECTAADEEAHSMFINEPLYQMYSASKLESIARDLEAHDDTSDGYEEIGQCVEANSNDKQISEAPKSLRPSALQLIEPKNGPTRTLWSEIPEVVNSCILLTLTPRERSLQESKFEIITSEASYLKSLNLLRSHFMNNPAFRDTQILSARDRKTLFSYIVPVHECADRLLTELESCWQDSIMLLGLSQRIYAIAEKYFHVYVAFCAHQGAMDRTLHRLKQAKGAFQQQLDKLEASATCCGLKLISFLMLPMQRITRLPLLIDAVFSKVAPNDDEYDSWKLTLAIINKFVAESNDAANRCEQAYEIEHISKQLEFPTTVRALAIAPVGVVAPGTKPRYLVKKGELTQLVWRGDEAKLTFGKRFSKLAIYAFLFSDLLVLTKRRTATNFTVFDYCPRSMITLAAGETLPQLPTKDISQAYKNLILLTLLENHERKTAELMLTCPSVSERERWLQALRPPEAETPGEKLYDSWDCPQVIAKQSYESDEPDALNLDIGDVVNVSRKLPDGWYQGERLRDGVVGWFPGSYTEEVNSAHVRARNLKQRYRLLSFAATYLESQKRKKF